MKLLDLKQQLKETMDRKSALLAAPAKDGREHMNTQERADYQAAFALEGELQTKINVIESRSTIHDFEPEALLDGSLLRKGESASFGAPGTTLTAALQRATPRQREEVRAFTQYVAGDMAALADLTPSGDGGVFIPTLVAGVIARNYAAFTPVRNAATVWPTDTGDPTRFPVISDTESAVILAPAASTGADSTVSGDTPVTDITGPLMGAFKFSSKPVFCPRETLTDATISVLEEMLGALLARIARSQNLKFTKGTGSGEPTGFLHDATAYAAGSVALDLDIALDLAYSVPALYRPNGIYMASDITIKYLRKLKTGLSGDKRALWKDAFEEGNATLGTPAKLHGYPIIVNNDMDSVANDGTFAGVSPLVFGDFKRHIIRDAEKGAPYVYRYSVPAKDGAAVIAFQRADSKLIVPEAISKLTVS